jgi:hypothetical protein
MIRPPQLRLGLVLAAALVLIGGCDGDDTVTGPPIDDEAPSVVITAAPDASPANVTVTVSFTATDGAALENVTCSWGDPGTPVDLFQTSGASLSASCSHTYDVPGEFTVVIRAKDAAGNEASLPHAITIGEPLPSAPTAVDVMVTGNGATVSWTPGNSATSQEVVLYRSGRPEPARAVTFADNVTSSTTFSDLAWDASYIVVVEAENDSGRAMSTPVSFMIALPAPVVTRFMPLPGDPTCLVVQWTQVEVAEGYSVFLGVAGMAGSIWAALPAGATEAEFCASEYPIVDGVFYLAKVGSIVEGLDWPAYSDNAIPYTVDFDPPAYSAAGTWNGSYYGSGSEWVTLELTDADGVITGSWTDSNASGSVTGIRIYGALELTFDWPYSGYRLHVQFVEADQLEGVLSPRPTTWVTLDRQ